jgi:dephospho-CoA kinase
MRLIGLTGSIGMGKSATAALFRSFGIPVFDADKSVHAIYARPPVESFRTSFPDALSDGVIDRARLAELLVAKPDRLPALERIIHPLVGEERQIFLRESVQRNSRCVVLDIPLLFETRATASVDVVVVVSAPADVQRQRVLARPGMTAERFEFILSKQVPDVDKRRGAHFVVETGHGFDYARRKVASLLTAIDGV